MVSVQQVDDKTFQVTVTGTTTTTHTVTVEPDYCKKLTGGRVRPRRLSRNRLRSC